MKRRDFYALRHALRAAIWSMTVSARRFDMADSALQVQHDSHAIDMGALRARIAATTLQLPPSSDPKGFAAMAAAWSHRRLKTFSALKTAAFRENDEVKYARAHARYFDFYNETKRRYA